MAAAILISGYANDKKQRRNRATETKQCVTRPPPAEVCIAQLPYWLH